MNKKLRSIISCAAAAAMIFTAAPASFVGSLDVYAAESASGETTAEAAAMKKALLDVKSRITIPSKLDKFSYEASTQYGTAFYEFKWYREVTRKNSRGTEYTAVPESITVRYYSGKITNYNYYDETFSYSTKKRGFAKLSVEQQKEYAQKYLKMLNPDMQDPSSAVITRQTSDNALSQNVVNYTISREKYGIGLPENNGYMTINRDTGELISFRLNWWNDAAFPNASKKLSAEEVSDIYAQKKGLTAYYNFFDKYEYNNKTGKTTHKQIVLPVYVPAVSGENEIDAISGEYTAYYADREKYSYTDAYKWTNNGAGMEGDCFEEEEAFEEDCDMDMGLTDEELNAIETENSTISSKKAIELLKADKFVTFNDDLVLSNTYKTTYLDFKGNTRSSVMFCFKYTSQKDTEDNIRLDVEMDAETGEIINFSKGYGYGQNSTNRNTTKVDHQKAVAVADSAAEHFMGEKAAEYTLTDSSTIYKNSTDQSLTYTRFVNGLPVPADTIQLTVDSRGEVLSYSRYYHDVKFPEANLVSADEAYKTLFKDMKPELSYKGFTDLKLRSHIYLTYTFDSYFMLNALTGERINTYDAAPYYTEAETAEDKVIAYTDITGHKYENEITTLLNYGIYITDSDKLCPDEAITIGEFMKLCSAAYGVNFSGLYPSKSKYNADTNSYVTIPHPDLTKKLTNGELARIYVYVYTNCSDAAQIEGIFKAPYSDVPETHKYCGYIAIAKAKGYLPDTDTFSPNKTFRKGDCLKKAYDFLANSQDSDLFEIMSR